jgi:hypothetical protein
MKESSDEGLEDRSIGALCVTEWFTTRMISILTALG